MEAFIAQHYLEERVEDATTNLIPTVLVLNHALQSRGDDFAELNESPPEDLHELLNVQAGRKITFLHQPQGQRRHWLAMAEGNAKIALTKRLVETGGQLARARALADILALDRRIGAYGFDQSQQVGYSGRCLPKDVRGFLHECDEAGIDSGWLVEMDRANARTLASQGLAVDFGWPLALKEAVHE